jgi:hypothetical protein
MSLALDAASGRSLDALAALRDRWQRLVDQGFGGLDLSAARHGL